MCVSEQFMPIPELRENSFFMQVQHLIFRVCQPKFIVKASKTMYELLFKRGHRIAKHSFFCSANQLTSVLSKRRKHECSKETKDVVRRCMSFCMSGAQSDHGG